MRVGGLFKVGITARSHLLAQVAKYAKSIIFHLPGHRQMKSYAALYI
jgi:hypothetical protein